MLNVTLLFKDTQPGTVIQTLGALWRGNNLNHILTLSLSLVLYRSQLILLSFQEVKSWFDFSSHGISHLTTITMVHSIFNFKFHFNTTVVQHLTSLNESTVTYGTN